MHLVPVLERFAGLQAGRNTRSGNQHGEDETGLFQWIPQLEANSERRTGACCFRSRNSAERTGRMRHSKPASGPFDDMASPGVTHRGLIRMLRHSTCIAGPEWSWIAMIPLAVLLSVPSNVTLPFSVSRTRFPCARIS